MGGFSLSHASSFFPATLPPAKGAGFWDRLYSRTVNQKKEMTMHIARIGFLAATVSVVLLLSAQASESQGQTNTPSQSQAQQDALAAPKSATGVPSHPSWREGIHPRLLAGTEHRTLLVIVLIIAHRHLVRKSMEFYMYALKEGALDMVRVSRAWWVGVAVGVFLIFLLWGFARWWAVLILIPLNTLLTTAALRSRAEGKELDLQIAKHLEDKHRNK
jgi:hypothetical protein